VAAAALALLVVPVVVAGCGDDEPTVTVRVTRDFGRELLAGEQLPLEGHSTALDALRANHRIRLTEYDTLAAIDGLASTAEPDGDARTWAINLNGIETDAEPGELELVDGDVVQFDLRDWYVTRDVRATVGAFPETFTNGILGVRFPVRVRCTPGYRSACRRVRETLRAAGVDPDGEPPGQPPATRRLRAAREQQSVARAATVLVGPWASWRDRRHPSRIDYGTRYSGVFATFSPDGSRLRLLDWDENVVRTAGPGSGLVAAMRPTDDLVWVVTGVDRRGVERAARTFDADALRDAFAVAVTDDGVEKLPLRKRAPDGVPAPRAGAEFPGRLLVRGVRAGLADADGSLHELTAGDGARRVGRLRCRRFHASPAGAALCLRVSANGFDYEAVALDGDFQPVARRRVEGIPSRVRVSRDGRYGAFTTFAGAGQGYLADTSEFSTFTRILDMRSGRPLARLERLVVRRDGRRVDLEDAELWGVTFGAEGSFYATLALADAVEHLLIEGRVGSRRARVVGDRVECPSFSPDGTRIAYKRRVGETDRWRLHVRHLASGRDVALSETGSIDDQPEWIGNRLVAYSDGKAVYAVAADGAGEPEQLAARATSPAWVPAP
jgi:hypothetical protein